MPVEHTTDAGAPARIHGHRAGDVLVYVWSDTCGPCQVVAPAVEALPDAYPNMLVLKAHVDQVPRLAADYGVRSLPTMLLFREGELEGMRVGTAAQSPWRDLIEFIDSHS